MLFLYFNTAPISAGCGEKSELDHADPIDGAALLAVWVANVRRLAQGGARTAKQFRPVRENIFPRPIHFREIHILF